MPWSPLDAADQAIMNEPQHAPIVLALKAAAIGIENNNLNGWQSTNVSGASAIINNTAAWLPYAQQIAADALAAKYEGIIAAGYNYAVAGGVDTTDHLYQIDEIPPFENGQPTRRASQDTMTTMTAWADQAVRGVNVWPSSFAWRDGDNKMVPMTAAQCLAFTQAAGAYVSACFANYATLDAEIMAAASYAAVQAIDITSGWPANNG